MNLLVLLFSFISLLDNFNEEILSADDRNFYYLYDSSDSLMYKEETKQKVDFFFCFKTREDTSPILFTCQKKYKGNIEIVSDISSYKRVFNRKDFIGLAKSFESYKKDKSILDKDKIVYFPKWIGTQFDNFYIIEKSGNAYKKYRVAITEVQIDYIVR